MQLNRNIPKQAIRMSFLTLNIKQRPSDPCIYGIVFEEVTFKKLINMTLYYT